MAGKSWEQGRSRGGFSGIEPSLVEVAPDDVYYSCAGNVYTS